MTAKVSVQDVATLAPIAEQAVIQAISLYRFIASNHSGVKPLEDVLAAADAQFDSVIDKAKAEIAKVTSKKK